MLRPWPRRPAPLTPHSPGPPPTLAWGPVSLDKLQFRSPAGASLLPLFCAKKSCTCLGGLLFPVCTKVLYKLAVTPDSSNSDCPCQGGRGGCHTTSSSLTPAGWAAVQPTQRQPQVPRGKGPGLKDSCPLWAPPSPGLKAKPECRVSPAPVLPTYRLQSGGSSDPLLGFN